MYEKDDGQTRGVPGPLKVATHRLNLPLETIITNDDHSHDDDDFTVPNHHRYRDIEPAAPE